MYISAAPFAGRKPILAASRRTKTMRFEQCDVLGAWVVSPSPHVDDRGRFMRAWCLQEFAERGIEFRPLQANMALSLRRGTLRGLHYQTAPALEAKLVRCTRGSIFDVVVDLRPDSKTFLKWAGADLSADNGAMLYVPERCAHGCVSLEDNSEVYYMTSAIYAPDCATGVRFDDPAIGIRWPVPVVATSEQDRSWALIDRAKLLES
jgi:dTDP-4-dehydrorhamnose 3,5-epimerase